MNIPAKKIPRYLGLGQQHQPFSLWSNLACSQESTKTVLKVIEMASDVSMLSQTIINKRLKNLLYSLARTGESSGEHILRTMAGILSGARMN